jgi:hypothetical protein
MSSMSLSALRPVAATAVLTMAAALPGCGSGGGGAATNGTVASAATTGATTTESQSTTATTESPQATAADRKIAQAATLRLSDFPSGWEESDTSSPSQSAKCPGIRTAKDTATVRESSSDFNTNNGNTTADNVIYVYSDEAAAQAALAALTGRDNRKCIGKQAADLVKDAVKKENLQVRDVTTGQVSVPAGVGDDRHALRITIPFTYQDTDITATVDYDIIRVGRGLDILELSDVLTPFDDDLRQRLARRSAARLRAALAAAEPS